MINDKIKKALEDAKCIRQETTDSGDLLSWYDTPSVGVLIVQEYANDRGCEVLLPVLGNNVDKTVSEIHGCKQLELEWVVRSTGRGYGGNWGKGENIAKAMDNANIGPEDLVHISAVSKDWELDGTFGTLSSKYGKHSKPFRLANFIHWEWLMRMAAELVEANGLKSYAIDKLTDKLNDLDMEDPGVKVPWIKTEE